MSSPVPAVSRRPPQLSGRLVTRLAWVVHDVAVRRRRPLVAVVRPDASGDELAVHEPAPGAHPVEVLVGVRVGAEVAAVCVSLPSTFRRSSSSEPEVTADESGHRPLTGAWSTLLRARDGRCRSVLDAADGPPTTLDRVPAGWVADVLARCLGRPTPPPTERIGRLVEGIWLDRVAAVVLVSPGRPVRWEHLAALHPLAPAEGHPSGAELAARTRDLECEVSWRRLRTGSPAGGPAPVLPPWGARMPLDRWFDDGSFARWTLRDHVPAVALCAAVLDAVPRPQRGELVDALVTVDAAALPGAR